MSCLAESFTGRSSSSSRPLDSAEEDVWVLNEPEYDDDEPNKNGEVDGMPGLLKTVVDVDGDAE